MISKIIVLHGGAGKWRTDRLERALTELQKIAQNTSSLLREKNALSAVEFGIKQMEKSDAFNAGCGAALNLLGEVEVDAGIMISDGNIGAVASVKNVMHPISLARIVMEQTDHLLISGEGARYLAMINGLLVNSSELITDYTRNTWLKAIKEIFNYLEQDKIKDDYIRYYLTEIFPKILKLVKEKPEILSAIKKRYDEWIGDTVGAVSFDGEKIVAGVSTGGIFLKFPGRVGDSPIIGAGFYASKKGGCVATGHGEQIMRSLLCKRAVDYLAKYDASQAVRVALNEALEEIGIRAGLIMVDNKGNWGVYHTTDKFPVAVVRNSEIIIKDKWK